MEEFEGRRTGMLTMGEWCNLVSNMLHHVTTIIGSGTFRRRRFGAGQFGAGTIRRQNFFF